MKAKNLREIFFTFIVSTFIFIGTVNAATFRYCTTGSIQTNTSWWSLAGCAGSHPDDLPRAGRCWFGRGGAYAGTPEAGGADQEVDHPGLPDQLGRWKKVQVFEAPSAHAIQHEP